MGNKGKGFKKKEATWLKVIKTAWSVAEKIIMVILIIISLIIATQKLSDNEKTFFGYRIFRVQTGSMIPVYEIGDVILVKDVDINKIKIGDDITYWGTTGQMKGKLVTHRVIDIEEQEGQKVFHAKGVANTSEDPLISAEQINGIVQGKLYVTTLMCRLLNNKYIFYFFCIMPLTICIFFAFVKNNKRFQ